MLTARGLRHVGLVNIKSRIALCIGAVALIATPATAASAGPPTTAPTTDLSHSGYSVQIRRTEYGIPHVLAGDFGSLGYGYGYAFAQDNLCVMADRVVTLRGERSRYFGPTANSDDTLAERPTTNLDSDTYYQAMRQSGTVQRLMNRPAPLGPTNQLHRLVAGYVAGYNRYLADTGVANLPDPTCRAAAWVTPITTDDVWTGIYDITMLNGSTSFRGQIASATPPVSSSSTSAAVPKLAADAADGIGSNGWALGKDITTDHDGMLLANPHFPWTGDGRFYQVQLTIPGQLDVSGASLYGTPVVELGHTTGLAWTHTVSSAQRYTIYQLKLVPGQPTSYLVDGKPVPMTSRTVTITETVNGQQTPVSRTVYGSEFGPVLATGWTSSTAFALRDANADNLRAMNEWLAMDQSQNLSQLHAAQNTYQGIPFTYTIATDTSGSTYFGDAGVVPNMTDAEAARCVDTPQGKANYPHEFIVDGSTSGCGWGTDADAIEPGIFGPRDYPQLSTTDYVANSNDSPWLTNATTPITGYPAIYGDTGTPRGARTRLGIEMINGRVSGADGLGAPGFTLATLRTIMLNNRDFSAEDAQADVVAMCKAHPTLTATNGQQVDVGQACDVLAGWNGRGDLASSGDVLWRQFAETPIRSDPSVIPFDPAHPLTTPSGLNGDNPDVQRAFADAAQFFQANNIPFDVTIAQAQHYGGVSIPGCTGGEGCFDVVDPQPLGSNGTYPDISLSAGHGSSFIMAVEMTPSGPQGSTLLTYSESANPDSPHHIDQTELFAHKQWVPDRFTQAQIDTDPQLQVTVLHA